MPAGKVVIINDIRVIAADGSQGPVMTDGAGLISRNLAEQMPLCLSGCGHTHPEKKYTYRAASKVRAFKA